GLFVGQQGGALDGGAEDGFVEGGLLVLVARDDVFEGGEGTFDKAGGERGAGAFAGGFRAANGEDGLGLGDGDRDGFARVVGEFLEEGEGLGRDDAARGRAFGLGGG